MLYTNKEEFKSEYLLEFNRLMGKTIEESSLGEKYRALVNLLREKISVDWVDTSKLYTQKGEKEVFYFSLEFLIGRLLPYYLINLGVEDIVKAGLKDLGINIEDIYQQEADAGLGNGGLGRLAACFLDSMAFLGVPGHGNGIRYRYGLFKQRIVDGYQVELPDNWLRNGYPWEIKRPEKSVLIKFRGNINSREENGRLVFEHNNYEGVMAVPYDIPMLGYEAQDSVNTLRLWSSEPVEEEFDLASFNRGDYSKFSNYKNDIEAISYILYPEDSSWQGRELRLKQEYFFVSAGLQDIIRSFKSKYKGDFTLLPQKVAIHINDTHPALCVPELMRILMDEEGLSWNEAWNLTVNTISFTNHTIMPEALEKWPIDMMKQTLPRIFMILEELNKRVCERLFLSYPDQWERIGHMAIIGYGQVHMANLCVAMCYSVNGVSQLHGKILCDSTFHDYYLLNPRKFSAITNGITHRRWLMSANPALTGLLKETIGDGFTRDAAKLQDLVPYADDAAFRQKFDQVKKQNKERLAKYLKETQGVDVDTNTFFDVQVKRIHEYKRQLLNILHAIHLYIQLKDGKEIMPRTIMIGGKSAPGYWMAKQIIRLANAVAAIIDADPVCKGKLKMVFLENYRVSFAEKIIPAADLSEQISTAGTEASGTGNMKFALNGALTIGTLDGANVEMKEEVGDENIFIFGLTVEEVTGLLAKGYRPRDFYEKDDDLRRVIDLIGSGFFSPDRPELFKHIADKLLTHDPYMLCADFRSYVDMQVKVAKEYQNKKAWAEKAILNVARMGKFSSDRTIKQYAEEIWHAKACSIKL